MKRRKNGGDCREAMGMIEGWLTQDTYLGKLPPIPSQEPSPSLSCPFQEGRKEESPA